jgi:hypothetical protein
VDDGAQIKIRDDIAGEVPGDDGEDGPMMEIMQTRGAGSDGTRQTSNIASNLATWLVKISCKVDAEIGVEVHGGGRLNLIKNR